MSAPSPPYRGQGLFTGTTSTRTEGLRVPQQGFDPPPGLGILLTIAALVPAAHDALDPDEFDARIAYHADRVSREEKAIRASQVRGAAGGFSRRPLNPEWKTCRCAACSCRLFGESMVGVPELPTYVPFVAGRVQDRPYCAGCLATIARRATK